MIERVFTLPTTAASVFWVPRFGPKTLIASTVWPASSTSAPREILTWGKTQTITRVDETTVWPASNTSAPRKCRRREKPRQLYESMKPPRLASKRHVGRGNVDAEISPHSASERPVDSISIDLIHPGSLRSVYNMSI
jgi:hypothetical protein